MSTTTTGTEPVLDPAAKRHKARRDAELDIVRAAVTALTTVPGAVNLLLDDGYELVRFKTTSRSVERVMKYLSDIDMGTVYALDQEGEPLAGVSPVFGNSPYEVLNNWSSELEELEAWELVRSRTESAEKRFGD